MECVATAAFSLEGVVKRELVNLGIMSAKGEMGCVRFQASPEDAFRANLYLRAADRVMLVMGEARVTSFEELFQLVRGLHWEELMPRDASFVVTGKCARSQLMSVRDCQAITKKAIVESMKQAYHMTWCPETGAAYPVDISIHGDIARVCVDMSGVALNRRGYRTWNGEAPLRETLAASLVELSPWRARTPLHDPCCGTGTLLIEAAFIASGRAPGMNRSFAMEQWPCFSQEAFKNLREEAKAAFHPEDIPEISGSDIDPAALELCRKHIHQAGLDGKINVFQKDLRELKLEKEDVFFIANPPYGERMGDRKSCEKLYHDMRLMRDRHLRSRLGVITAHTGFERCYGMRCTKKYRLYNGRLECEYLIY